jgi:hypothetical protein
MDGFDPKTSFGYEVSKRYNTHARGDEEETIAFLARLAGQQGALEFAIGAGRIALPLTKAGVHVDGIELSRDMVDRMREKPGGNAIEVVIGDMSRVTTGCSYGLVYLVYNTIGNLLTQDDQVRCFQNAARHLTRDGAFVLECRVPTAPSRPGPDRGPVVPPGTAGPRWASLWPWSVARAPARLAGTGAGRGSWSVRQKKGSDLARSVREGAVRGSHPGEQLGLLLVPVLHTHHDGDHRQARADGDAHRRPQHAWPYRSRGLRAGRLSPVRCPVGPNGVGFPSGYPARPVRHRVHRVGPGPPAPAKVLNPSLDPPCITTAEGYFEASKPGVRNGSRSGGWARCWQDPSLSTYPARG